STCEDIEVEKTPDGSITELNFCVDRVDAKAGRGDSGSPVFIGTQTKSPYSVKLCGILIGGALDWGESVGDNFNFTPFGLIEGQLDSLKVTKVDESPTVEILEPANNEKVSYGGFSEVTFQAKADDFESGSDCCTIAWKSDKDGDMGTGETLQFHFTSPGKR